METNMSKKKIRHTPYQLGRFAYQDDQNLRENNPFSRKDSGKYHGWKKGWSQEKWMTTRKTVAHV